MNDYFLQSSTEIYILMHTPVYRNKSYLKNIKIRYILLHSADNFVRSMEPLNSYSIQVHRIFTPVHMTCLDLIKQTNITVSCGVE